jgi:hypothetical protein
LVNDSEYSKSAGAKPIFRSLLAVFISFPWRAVSSLLLLLRQLPGAQWKRDPWL